MNKQEFIDYLQSCLFAWEDDGQFSFRCSEMKIPLHVAEAGRKMASYCKTFKFKQEVPA